MVATREIRVFGDPVLRQVTPQVTEIDGALVRLAQDMIETIYEVPGRAGLAAPQVGVERRLFVYDGPDGPTVIVNPVISESRGEWLYEEGCLSVPGMAFEIVRPKEVYLTGIDLDGNDVAVEADEFLARLYQHEVDHLDGILLLDRLDGDQRREAMRVLRERTWQEGPAAPRQPEGAGGTAAAPAGVPGASA
ncbi:MAG: peptide deformylase [Actinomycetota bacterium]|nr:peptide deformylase [Actinomycetota bacterium]